uniref:cytosol aminopeptidase isoform X2 n=1 Tax=Myxine glutinosa TaxID=7769 RepID=UPI00358E6517
MFVMARPLLRAVNGARHVHASFSSLRTKKGLVLGVYENSQASDPLLLTNSAEDFNKRVQSKLKQQLSRSGCPLKKGKSRTFHGLDEEFAAVVLVGLGKQSPGIDKLEHWDEGKENVRAAVAAGCKQMQELEVEEVQVDSCGDAQAAAEGALLSLYFYDELKQKKKPKVSVSLLGSAGADAWQKGILLAEGQNLARLLMEAPANHMTPSIFSERIQEKLKVANDQVKVYARSKSWIEEKKMGAFLSVTRGSEEAPVFLEIHYNGKGSDLKDPLVLVGKGITFDSGGISLKPSAGMDNMRADMGGAATICSAIITAVALKLPINIIGLAPLCENMPSGKATKPGDVVTAANGKTIQVDNTDAEGRLVLADALCYAHTFNPRAIINAATLTGAIMVALGSAATGVFTNSDWIWTELKEASVVTGDRVWRMPLFQHYTKQIMESQLADVNNIGGTRYGGSCTAAAFLREFVTAEHWAHLDIAGVMENKDEVPYLGKGMAGRPTRTLVEFISRLAEKDAP